jgi:hypothetical protein
MSSPRAHVAEAAPAQEAQLPGRDQLRVKSPELGAAELQSAEPPGQQAAPRTAMSQSALLPLSLSHGLVGRGRVRAMEVAVRVLF